MTSARGGGDFRAAGFPGEWGGTLQKIFGAWYHVPCLPAIQVPNSLTQNLVNNSAGSN